MIHFQVIQWRESRWGRSRSCHIRFQGLHFNRSCWLVLTAGSDMYLALCGIRNICLHLPSLDPWILSPHIPTTNLPLACRVSLSQRQVICDFLMCINVCSYAGWFYFVAEAAIGSWSRACFQYGSGPCAGFPLEIFLSLRLAPKALFSINSMSGGRQEGIISTHRQWEKTWLMNPLWNGSISRLAALQLISLQYKTSQVRHIHLKLKSNITYSLALWYFARHWVQFCKVST